MVNRLQCWVRTQTEHGLNDERTYAIWGDATHDPPRAITDRHQFVCGARPSDHRRVFEIGRNSSNSSSSLQSLNVLEMPAPELERHHLYTFIVRTERYYGSPKITHFSYFSTPSAASPVKTEAAEITDMLDEKLGRAAVELWSAPPRELNNGAYMGTDECCQIVRGSITSPEERANYPSLVRRTMVATHVRSYSVASCHSQRLAPQQIRRLQQLQHKAEHRHAPTSKSSGGIPEYQLAGRAMSSAVMTTSFPVRSDPNIREGGLRP